MITVEGLIELFIDDAQMVQIYDNEADKVIYEGMGCDVPDELMDEEVSSIDNLYKGDFNGFFTINIR